MSLAGVQAYAMARPLDLPTRAKTLFRELRNQLVAASNAGLVVESPDRIFKLLRLLPEPPAQILESLRARSLHEHAFCIVGGEKNQQRDDHVPHFKRDDDAWFDFSITVYERDRQLELLAYDFELRFPPGAGLPFLRLDLNLPDHDNEARELRCHLHPGTDDLLVPAPMMTPSEVLALFVEGIRLPAHRASRAVTTFESRWFALTHLLTRS
jgi:hypothetical protein